MPILRYNDASRNPSSSLRLPATKRISSAATERLSTILEGDRDNTTPASVPLRSSLRNSNTSSTRWQPQRPGPPAYGYAPSSIIDEEEDLTAPVEGEKLARLRRGEHSRKSRGGFWRLLVIALLALIVIGLAVGLGVGLTVGRRGNGDNGGSSGASSNSSGGRQALPFPIGEYSFVTALRVQQTNCSAKAAAWRCYPYSTFAESNSTSLSTFNWIISNTSSEYAGNTTGATPAAGIPANLTISSQNNPFAIAFSNQTLTYINDSNNSSSPRYAFQFTMTKVVVPFPAITSNNQASQCFFNSTIFAGFLYLNAPRTFPDTQLRSSTAVGGYPQWPYAVEITQTSPGGNNVPDCYETINGVSTDRIINGLDPQSRDRTCLCDYRNY